MTHILIDRATLQQVINALKYASTGNRRPEVIGPLTEALEALLAAPCEPQPIAYFDFQERGFYWAENVVHGPVPVSVKIEPMLLYAAPPAQPASEPSTVKESLT
jgi:hypothetical protein